MRYGDGEQWLGLAVAAGWLLLAVLSTMGRVPRAGRLSRSTLLATGVAAGLFAVQSTVVDAVADRDKIAVPDGPALGWFVAHRTPAATAFFTGITTVGGIAGMVVLAALATLVLWLRGGRREAAVVALAGAGAVLLVQTLKNVYNRPRPPEATRLVVEASYALPSGHALASTAVLGILAAVTVRRLRRPGARVAVVVLAALLAGTIGVSRLYLGVHWLTDVLNGWLVGGAWLALCVAVLLRGPSGPDASDSQGADGRFTSAPSAGPPRPGRGGRAGSPSRRCARRGSGPPA